MIINVIDRQRNLSISSAQVRRIVKAVITNEKQKCDEVGIFFVETSEICRLHEQFFNDPSPTDCISFSMDDCTSENMPFRQLGEVFVCPATAVAYAAQHDENPFKETTLYIVHGLLHLMGYNDIQEEDVSLMRQAEAMHMLLLQNDPKIGRYNWLEKKRH